MKSDCNIGRIVAFVLATTLLCVAPDYSQAQDVRREAIVAKAIDYLRHRGQQDDGAFSPKVGIGVTALAATALIQNDVPLNDPMVAKAVKLVADVAREDGGIHLPDSCLNM